MISYSTPIDNNQSIRRFLRQKQNIDLSHLLLSAFSNRPISGDEQKKGHRLTFLLICRWYLDFTRKF